MSAFSPPQAIGPFRISYDDYLGDFGAYCANIIAASCIEDLQALMDYFQVTPSHADTIDIYLTALNTGASHPTCLSTQISVGALTDPKGNAPLLRALMVAELAEVFMASKNNGWNCGYSNGEGLSRVICEEICPGTIPPSLCSAPAWLDNGRPNYVDATYPSDTDFIPIGCSVLFLYWLHYQLNYPWQHIIAAGGVNLEQTYSTLTGGRTDGSAYFYQLINWHYPSGVPCNLQSDNIFPILFQGS